MSDLEKLRRERNLYRRLLDLGTQRELPPFLRDALALVVEVTHSARGYVEVRDDAAAGDGACWSIAHGFTDDEVATVRAAISRGIVAEALATGKTIVTPSALLDPRFRERGSVQAGRIEAVLCAPIGADPAFGVLYLQRRPGDDAFSPEDQTNAEVFARHLTPFADRLLVRGRQEPDPTRPYREQLRLDRVVGRSPTLATVLRQVASVAPLEISILLTGESGTGKSQIARVIHDNGPRAAGPFVEVNCGALPETLIESELFGALPGAHSTAVRKIEGKVGAAEHGTLFLDEIGDLTPAAQVKLLQLLQAKEYHPLGAAKPVRADVRLVTATNKDLKRAVAERRFRDDLFYRLEVMPIRVPSLAERREDIAELATFFCAAASERHGLPHASLSPGALRSLQSAEWPGNIRQLAHAVEAGAIRAAGERAAQIEIGHLFPSDPGSVQERDEAQTFQVATRRFQARLLRDTLVDAGWNVSEVARRLDLTRSHVYNLIHAFGLERATDG